MGALAGILPAAYAPEQREHRLHDVFDVRAERGRLKNLAKRDVRQGLQAPKLDLLGERFLWRQVWGVKPGIAQLLQLFIRWPAKPGLLAVAPQREVAPGIGYSDTIQGGDESAPAALVRRVLTGPPRDHRTPVHRLEVHGQTKRLKQRAGYLRPRAVDGTIAGGQQHDRFTAIT